MLESLQCNACGVSLEVPPNANFIKCNHCGTSLAVRRNENVTFTEAIEQLNSTTENLAHRVDELTRQNQVAELDRRWEQERESYMVSTKNGQRLPSRGSAVGGVFGVVVGTVWGVFAGAAFPPFALFGALIVIFSIYGMVSESNKVTKYERAKREYERYRASLLRGNGESRRKAGRQIRN